MKKKTVSFQEKKDLNDKTTHKFPWKFFIKYILTGYVAGLSTTIIWFLYYTYKLPCLQTKSNLLILFGLLGYGCLLLYSKNVRCISTLIIPILFSSKGRSLLVASAVVMAATGPTANTVKNVDILMKSISCGQEQLKQALGNMLDMIKRPLVTIKNAIKVALIEIKKVLKKVKEVLIKVKKTIVDIMKAIKNAFKWLGSVMSMCNKKMGTPFDRCIKIADDAINDCRDKMGAFKGLCNVTDIFRALCYSVKFIDVICDLVDLVSGSIVGTIQEKFQKFTDEIKAMFYVSIKFDHEFNFKTVASKNLSTVGNDIMQEIKSQFSEFFVLCSWVECVGSLMVFMVVLKAMLYKSKYLTSNNFDNHFINKDFVEINKQREKMGKETVLPLKKKEARKYAIITSPKLARAELVKLSSQILFLLITSVQLMCACIADYSLFWLLSMIYNYGSKEANLEVPPFLTVNISGGSFTSDILKGIVDAFGPLTEKYEVDQKQCLPKPSVPHFKTYWKIAGVLIMAWVSLFAQPYGLRLRQVVMRAYYPIRSKERALWLYSDILKKRTSLLKFARRKARSKILKDGKVEDYSFLDWLRARTNRFWITRKIFGISKLKNCNLCGSPLKGEDTYVKCEQIGCGGMYCKECYAELNNICCLCRNPVDYGDMSDISEEKDSSAEELVGVQVDKRPEEPRETEESEGNTGTSGHLN